MRITDIVSTDYATFDADARASELEGTFRDTGVEAVVIIEDGEYLGIVTPRQLAGGRRNPDAKARGLVWRVARVDVDEDDDVRTVARLLVGSRAPVLPVFDGDELRGIITADDLLSAVSPFLGVLTVEDVYSNELVSVDRDATVGEALHLLREYRITHLPVLDGDDVAGILGLADVLSFSTREMRRAQGGSSGGGLAGSGGSRRGGFGERAGELERMLDVPVSEVMTEPVRTTTPETRLDDAVETMLEAGISSLVVERGREPVGILTKTDALRSLTWEVRTTLPVQITGIDLLDDITREEVAELIEDAVRKYGDLSVLEANVDLHEHKETFHGLSLIRARIRLFTDKGHFVGTGEGYGATHALHLARNVLEREILEGKEYGRTKKHPSDEELSKMLGWWLVGSPRAR